MTPAELTRVDVAGLRLRCFERGRGREVVLLHGYPETLLAFHRLAPLLADAGCRAHAFDWPGHGQSDAPHPWDYSAPSYARVLGEFFERRSIARATVVAAGFAVLPALMFALARPERVERLVLSNGAGPYRPEFQGWQIRALLTPVVGEMFMRLRGASALRSAFTVDGRPIDLAPEVYRDFAASALDRGRQRATLQLFRGFARDQRSLGEGPLALRMPALVVWGERDQLIRRGMADALQAFTGAALALVADAGHYLALEQPEIFARHILAFADAERRAS